MDKATLENYIGQGFSTHQMAIATGKSQTNIRYWLKKHQLQTTVVTQRQATKFCCTCKKQLHNNQIKFCSNVCKYQNGDTKKSIKLCSEERGTKRKIDLVNLAGGKCQICGYDKNYAALQFHHINPKEKNGSLSIDNLRAVSWDWCLTELKKCQLLCSNCHTEQHNPRFTRMEKVVRPVGLEPT